MINERSISIGCQGRSCPGIPGHYHKDAAPLPSENDSMDIKEWVENLFRSRPGPPNSMVARSYVFERAEQEGVSRVVVSDELERLRDNGDLTWWRNPANCGDFWVPRVGWIYPEPEKPVDIKVWVKNLFREHAKPQDSVVDEFDRQNALTHNYAVGRATNEGIDRQIISGELERLKDAGNLRWWNNPFGADYWVPREGWLNAEPEKPTGIKEWVEDQFRTHGDSIPHYELLERAAVGCGVSLEELRVELNRLKANNDILPWVNQEDQDDYVKRYKWLAREGWPPTEPKETDSMTSLTIRELMRQSHATAKNKGWWDEGDRPFGEQIALMHSELSEALEAYRDGDDMTEINYEYDKAGNPKPIGVASEFADVLIRIGDTCAKYSIPLEEALVAKMAYNETRPHRHGGKKI